MDAIAKVTEWLNGNNDYLLGVKLYQQYGFSRILKNLFIKGQNAYNSEKLKAELQNILLRLKKEQDKIIRTKVVQNPIKDVLQPFIDPFYNLNIHPEKQDIYPVKRYSELKVPEYEFKNLPEKLKYEWQLRIKLFKEAEAHHYRLNSLTSKEERKESVDIIITNFIQIDKYWQRLDYWGKHGIILPEVDVIKYPQKKEYTNPVEMLKRRNNLRSSLTKARKRIGLLKDNDIISALNQKIAYWEIEKADIEEKLEANG